MKKGTIIPYEPPQDAGVWLPPQQACKYFRYGRGIQEKTLMNKIYAGELKKHVKWTPAGWLIFINNEMLEQQNKTA